jgi:hypothetical protein
MDQPILRLLIREKLADGRLPHTPVPRVWSGSGSGETCDGCGQTVTKAEMAMEGLDAKGCGVQFHVACFHVWDVERQAPGHGPSARLPARSAFRAPDARPETRPWSRSAPSARPASSASP